jgi:hypothetical protein
VNAPIVRGTARRLGLRLPVNVYYAPLRWVPITEVDLSEFTKNLAEALQNWKPGTWQERKP